MHRCKACSSPVPNPKERRLLESTTSSSVRIGLVQFSRKVQDDASLSIDEHFSHGYVCKKCFGVMEKFLSLSYKLTELENMISSNLSETLISFGLSGSQKCQRGTKRILYPSQRGTCTLKRMRIANNPASLTSDPVLVSYKLNQH